MTTSYEIWLTSDAGVRLAPLSNILSLEASKVDGKIGAFRATLPLSFNPDLIAPDRLIQIWRQPEGGLLGLWGVYLLREWEFSTQGSRQMLEIGGPDMKDLLARRIVAHYAGSSNASKTDNADNIIKAIVRDAIANGSNPAPTAGTRVWSNLSVEADVGLGPTLTWSFPWDYLLTNSGGILVELQKASREAGTEVFFDIVPNVVSTNSITFQFVTKIGQPGQDVSDRVTFDQGSGNMKNPRRRESHRQEKNYIYAGGQGEKSTRNIQQVYDSARYGQSIWGRCEGFADARDQSTDNGVREVGRAALEDGRPTVTFTAQPVDTESTRFGIDWDFGYRVGAKYLAWQFNCIIRAATISLDDSGKEDIRARLDYEAAI